MEEAARVNHPFAVLEAEGLLCEFLERAQQPFCEALNQRVRTLVGPKPQSMQRAFEEAYWDAFGLLLFGCKPDAVENMVSFDEWHDIVAGGTTLLSRSEID